MNNKDDSTPKENHDINDNNFYINGLVIFQNVVE